MTDPRIGDRVRLSACGMAGEVADLGTGHGTPVALIQWDDGERYWHHVDALYPYDDKPNNTSVNLTADDWHELTNHINSRVIDLAEHLNPGIFDCHAPEDEAHAIIDAARVLNWIERNPG